VVKRRDRGEVSPVIEGTRRPHGRSRTTVLSP
jgi:hypothetical protein